MKARWYIINDELRDLLYLSKEAWVKVVGDLLAEHGVGALIQCR